MSNLLGVLTVTADATIASLQDQDYYSFNTLLSLGAVDVTLRTDGISLLTPQVTIYNASRKILAQAATTDPTAGGLVIHLSNVAPLSTYYIEVQSGQQNAFGIGSYELGLRELPLVNNLLGGVTATVSQGVHDVTSALINNDPLHLDSSFATARPLPLSTGYGGTGYASYRASLSGTSDVDYFTLRAPPAAPGAISDVLTAMVWGLENSLNLQVHIFDASHNPVAGQVLVKDGFSNVVEVTNAIPGNTYIIEVLQVANRNGASAGNYCLYVAASPVGVVLQNYLGGTLTAGQPEKVNWLRVGARSELFHFVLAAQSAGATTVQMTITNATGHVVFSLVVGAGDAVSGDVLLVPGTYTLLFTARADSGTAQPSLMYQLSGQTLTDPQGPESTDPSGDPSGSPGTDPNAGPDLGSGAGNGVPSQDPTSPPPNGADTPYVSLYNPGDQTSFTGAAVSVALSAYDSASNPMTYAATGLPAGVTIDSTSGVMSGTIANSAASDTAYVVSVTATDSAGSSGTQTFTWAVNLPVVTITSPGDQADLIGDNVNMTVSASSSDSATLTYSAAALPAGLTIDSASGTISGTIANDAATGTPYSVTITATDSTGGVSGTQTFTWTVNLPVVTVTSPGDQTNTAGDYVNVAVSASSSDSATLTYSAAGLPDGLTIDSASGTISGTIANDAATGTPYSVTVTATDSNGGVSGIQTFTWTVNLTVVTVTSPGDQTNTAGDYVNVAVSASSSDSATLTYSAAGLPAGLTIDSASGTISGTIANDAATGTPYSVTITATDSTGGVSGTQTFTWTVNLPVVTITSPGDQTNTAGDYVNVAVSASSSDSYAVTFSATGFPPGLTIDGASGAISGTIANNAGSDHPYVVTITATDASSGVTTSETFNWTVAPPVVTVASPSDQINSVGDAVSFAVSASASNNASLTFTASGLPPGLSIDSSTGLISGTVTDAAAGGSYDVSLTVTDASSGASVTVVFEWQIA